MFCLLFNYFLHIHEELRNFFYFRNQVCAKILGGLAAFESASEQGVIRHAIHRELRSQNPLCQFHLCYRTLNIWRYSQIDLHVG